MSQNKFTFDQVVARLKQAQVNLPWKLANIAQNYFASTFRTGSFDGRKWQEVQRRMKPAPPSDRQANKRGILIGKTRNLMDSVRHSIREVSWERITLGTDVPYASTHNEGTDKIPKREFMGDAKELRDQLDKEIRKQLAGLFK